MADENRKINGIIAQVKATKVSSSTRESCCQSLLQKSRRILFIILDIFRILSSS